MGASLIIGLSYGLPLLWAILVVVRLGDQRKLLKQIADDMSALRRSVEEGRSIVP